MTSIQFEHLWLIRIKIRAKRFQLLAHTTLAKLIHGFSYTLTHLPQQNGCHFTDNIFRCIFMNEKFCILIKISLKFVPKSPIYEHQYFEFHRPIVYSIEGMAKRPWKLYISNITNHLYSKSTCPADNWHRRAINEDKTIMGYFCHLYLQFDYDPLVISELLFMFFLDWPANVILLFHVTIGNLWKLFFSFDTMWLSSPADKSRAGLTKWHNAAVSFSANCRTVFAWKLCCHWLKSLQQH